MPLWYDCGGGVAKARMARHDLGQPVILCAPGPSMEKVERQPGVMIAALTKAYPTIKPDIWFGLDTPECYDRRVWFESFMKIARAAHHAMTVDGIPVRSLANVFLADCREMAIMDIFRERGHDASFGWWIHTLGAALHILIWMGARTIYLNGFDLRSVNGRDYAEGVDKILSAELRAGNQRLFDLQVKFLRDFAHYAKLNGISVISCTPDSPVNEFLPYVSLAMAVTMSQKRVPAPGKLFHSMENQALDRKALGGNVLPFSRDGLKTAIRRAQIRKAIKAQKGSKPVTLQQLKPISARALAIMTAPLRSDAPLTVLPALEPCPTGKLLGVDAA